MVDKLISIMYPALGDPASTRATLRELLRETLMAMKDERQYEQMPVDLWAKVAAERMQQAKE